MTISAAEPARQQRSHPDILTLVVFALLSCLRAATAAGAAEDPIVLRGATMGTTYTVKYRWAAIAREEMAKQIEGVLEEVNRQMSTYRQDSEISRFNRSRGNDWFPVSPWFAQVVEAALAISRISDGAFDVTVAPLVDLWGFGPGAGDQDPAQQEIDQRLQRIGWHHLTARGSPPAIRKDLPGLSCDLSAIAKGFGVDVVGEVLARNGAADFMVEIGGEVLAHGNGPQQSGWRIGIETPDAPGGVSRIVQLNDRAMATSGDYRNFFERDGARYSHIIAPHTGRPVNHRLASVSVIAQTCMEADGLATAIDVLGPDQGMALAGRQKLAMFMLVRTNGGGFEERMTPGFRERLVNMVAPSPAAGDLGRFAVMFAVSLFCFLLFALVFLWRQRNRRGGGCACRGAEGRGSCASCGPNSAPRH